MSALFIGTETSRSDWDALRSAGLPVGYLDLASVLRSLTVRIAPSQVSADLLYESQLTEPGTVVWYHPGTFELLEQTLVDGEDPDRYGERQYAVALAFLESWLTEHAICVDPPALQRKWSDKLLQLRLLAEGFPDSVVETTLTSYPLSDGGMVVKHAGESRRLGPDHAFYARRLTPEAAAVLQAGQPTPMLVQPEIRCPVEYRTFLFDGAEVTVNIPRDRMVDVVDVYYSPSLLARTSVVETPMPWSLLRALQDATGLRFAAIDYFVVAGQPRILEINPLFSWSWLPAACMTAVTECIGKVLAGLPEAGGR